MERILQSEEQTLGSAKTWNLDTVAGAPWFCSVFPSTPGKFAAIHWRGNTSLIAALKHGITMGLSVKNVEESYLLNNPLKNMGTPWY